MVLCKMLMSVIAFIFAMFSVFIAIKPEIVLKIPKIGFIFYHIVAGVPIPPYMYHTYCFHQ